MRTTNQLRRRRNVVNWWVALVHHLYGAPPAPQFYTDPLNVVYTDPLGQGYTD